MGASTWNIAVFIQILASVLSFDPFSDNTLFDVSWAGPLREVKLTEDGRKATLSPDAVFITTKDNERYKCVLPSIRTIDEGKQPSQSGPTPEEMLKPLYLEERCSYRLEPYWNYELCHGKHIRQFHEDRTPQGVKIQEFYLGRMQKNKESSEFIKQEELTKEPTVKPEVEMKKIPTRKIDGIELPYYEVIIGNGTPCDLLESTPRRTHILYICNPRAQNEIRSVKELQTCEYEVELMTPLLCANDNFRPKEEIVNQIQCHSMDNSPREPLSYVSHIKEQILTDMGPKETTSTESESTAVPSDKHRKVPLKPDKQLTRQFLTGDYCLTGGKGWWKFEFCNGRHVLQYHEERGRRVTTIFLGSWNKQKHLNWFGSKAKSAKISGQVTHFYSDGDICDDIGQRRNVQVKMKCKISDHSQEFSTYLMEPEKCKYVFVVESPIVCPLIEHSDEHELFPEDVLNILT